MTLNRADSNNQFPILTFSLGEQKYALLIEEVVEVASMVEIMSVPDARPEVLGVINRHGAVLPLLDMRLVFGHEAHAVTSGTFFVVISCEGQQIGLVVDELHQVEYVESSQFNESTATGKFIRGIISYKSELIQVIDPPALLSTFVVNETEG